MQHPSCDIAHTVFAYYHQVAARSMVARQSGGAIVNVSSLGTRAELPTFAVYCCSKAAIERLTKSMAQELGPHQVRGRDGGRARRRRWVGGQTTAQGGSEKTCSRSIS